MPISLDVYEIIGNQTTWIDSGPKPTALSLSLALYYNHPFSLILAALLLFIAIAAAILICYKPSTSINN